MNAAAYLRERIRPLLPDGAFLRRDRGGLFVTDAPVRGAFDPAPLREMGFKTEIAGGIARISCGEGMCALLDELALAEEDTFLSRSARRFIGGIPACPRELDAVLRALDEGRADPACEMAVRAAMARALREKKGGSGLYAACRLLSGPPFFLYG